MPAKFEHMSGIFIIVLLSTFCLSIGELYTSMADLEEALVTEHVLINMLDSYIDRQVTNLIKLKRIALEFRKSHNLAMKDVNEYVNNPINAFLLIKRLTRDWNVTEELMTGLSQEVKTDMMTYKKNLKFPGNEDLYGAAMALTRLKDMYGLDMKSIVKGKLNDRQYSNYFSTSDCFELGRQLLKNGDYYLSIQWLQQALEMYEERTETELQKWQILEYYAYSTYKKGFLEKAMELTEELLEIYPDHSTALYNIDLYKKRLADGKEETKENYTNLHKTIENEEIKLTCQGAVSPPPTILANLKCKYVHNNHPYLRIAPLKEEEAFLSPRILIYRQVMYDFEIEVIKNIAKPKLKRAKVDNFMGKQTISKQRVSKSAWLDIEEDPVIERMAMRIEHMTGLTTSTAETLQVANYGIGGFYAAHYDYDTRKEGIPYEQLGTGNRIASLLFYMSDVAEGGATVFPLLNLTVWPERGSALFWFNLLPNGEGDIKTKHAACPVLVGSKWVSNVWFHERGQEFLRPCATDFNARNI